MLGEFVVFLSDLVILLFMVVVVVMFMIVVGVMLLVLKGDKFEMCLK